MTERARITVLLVLVTLVYANSLLNGFAYDDYPYILENQAVTNLSLRGLFHPTNPDPSMRFFRPVTFASYDLNWAIGRGHAFGYHLLNLVLHACVVLLLYKLLKRLLEGLGEGTTIAWITALLFAVHPIHTEAVSYIVGRSELLAAMFLLMAWVLHLRDKPIASAIVFLLALLSKESAIAFVPLALVGDHVRGKVKPVSRYVGIAGMAGLYVALLWAMQGGRLREGLVLFLINPLAWLPAKLRLLNALRIAWKYVGLQLAPVSLSCDYSYAAIPLYATWQHTLPAAIAAAVLVALWIRSVRQPSKEWFLAGAIYFAGFAATANILLSAGTVMGERLAYFPSAGLCLALALLWFQLNRKWPQAGWVTVAVVVTLLSVRTIARNQDWHDNSTLFSSALKVVPQDAKMLDAVGGEYIKRGRPDIAQPLLERAIMIYPNYPEELRAQGVSETAFRFVNLAEQATRMKERGDAMVFANMAIAESPRFSLAWSTRAGIEYDRGQPAAATNDARTAQQLDPENAQAQQVLNALQR